MNPPPGFQYPPLQIPQQHPPAQQQQSDPNFSPLVIALIGILASAFLLVSYYTVIAKYCTKWEALRPRGQRDEVNDPFPVNESWPVMTRGLDESVIESIPVFKYKPGDMMVDDTECAVCLSEFQEDESLRLLPKCTHAFHVPCIDMWLTSHSNCPLCRANIVNLPASPHTTEGEETGNEENSEFTIDSPLQEQSESEAGRESSEDESGRRTVSETRGLLPISHVRAQSDLVLKHGRSDSSSQSRRLALSEIQQQYKAMRRCYSVDSSRRIAISITDLLAIHLALEDGKLKELQSSSEAGGSGSFTVSFVPTPTSSRFIATSVSSRFAPTPVSSRFVPISASSSLDLEDGKSRSLSSVYEAQVGPSFSVPSSNPAEEQSLATEMPCASSKILNKQCSVDRNKSTMRRSFSGGKFFFLRNSRGRNAPILPP